MRRVAGGTDDLAERPVEPIGDGGTAVGDAADRSGMAAKPEPAMADHQLRTGQRGRLGVAEQVGDELTRRSAGDLLRSLDARREGRDAPFRGTGGSDPCMLEPRPGPGCDLPWSVASVSVTSWTGRAAPAA